VSTRCAGRMQDAWLPVCGPRDTPRLRLPRDGRDYAAAVIAAVFDEDLVRVVAG